MVLVWSLASAEARAASQDEKLTRLDYFRGKGGEACPDERNLRRAIATRVGYDPFSDKATRVLTCRIEGDAEGLRAEIAVRTIDGTLIGARSLRSRDRNCADLAPALYLVLSIAAGSPEAPSAPPATAPPVLRASAPAVASPVFSPSPPTLARPATPEIAARPVEVRLGAALVATDGSLPGPSIEGAGSIGLVRASNGLSLEIAADAPRSLTVAGGQVMIWRASSAIVPCHSYRVLFGCALIDAGLLHGAGQGIPAAQTATAYWFGLGARLGFRTLVGPASFLEVRADLLAPLVRTRLLAGDTSLWTTPAASGALGLALIRVFR